MLIPDIARCNCNMEGFTTSNHNHDDACRLWWEVDFCMGDEHWNAELQRMEQGPYGTAHIASASTSPWVNADDYIWDGDTPVIRTSTALERTVALPICAHELEALDAITDTNVINTAGIVDLPDGSYADMESRITYRHQLDEDGHPLWVCEDWDATPTDDSGMVSHSPDDVPGCHCIPQEKWDCLKCDSTRATLSDSWKWMTSKDRAEVMAWSNAGDGWATYAYANTCVHCFDHVEMPGENDVDIRASKARKHTTSTMPDFGVYASEAWKPDCPSIYIPWQDFGLPTCDFTHAAKAIKRAWTIALEGETVEVGCVGSHGRTGTILACFAVLADTSLTPQAAIAHVRAKHCNKAVEVADQEWFVAWFRAWHLDLPFSQPRPGLNYLPKVVATPTSIPVTTPVGPSTAPNAVTIIGPNNGNVAPGQTANARRREAKRMHRANKAKREKVLARQNHREVRSSR